MLFIQFHVCDYRKRQTEENLVKFCFLSFLFCISMVLKLKYLVVHRQHQKMPELLFNLLNEYVLKESSFAKHKQTRSLSLK